MACGAVVVLSDGSAMDEPDDVAESMRRLRRLAHRVVWVNPRKAATGYPPLGGHGGGAAALRRVRGRGHSLAALEQVVAAVRDDVART